MDFEEKVYTGLNSLFCWAEYTLQKHWKWILIIVLLLIVIFSIKSCNENKQRVKELEIASHFNDSLSNSQIKQWKDENDQLHYQVDNLFVDQFALQDQLDSVSKLLNIKSKQIQSISYTGTELSLDAKPKVDTSFKKIPCDGQDSLYVASAFDLSYRDPWIKVWGTLNGTNDSIHVEGTDTLKRVDYWKRSWFLGAKHYYSDITNTNTHIKLIGYKGAEIRPKERKWVVAVGGGVGYPSNSIQFKQPVTFFGVFVGYSIFNF
jgi:hypothetical protein